MLLWHTGSQERARACAERALEQAPGDAASLSLLGWILIHQPHAGTDPSSFEPVDLEQAAGLFEQVLLKQPRHTEVTCCCCSRMVQCCRVSPPPSMPPPSQNLNTISYAVLLMHKATHYYNGLADVLQSYNVHGCSCMHQPSLKRHRYVLDISSCLVRPCRSYCECCVVSEPEQIIKTQCINVGSPAALLDLGLSWQA